MFWDPDGLHNEAGHFFTVYGVARAVGFNEKDAMILAFYTQLPDEIEELDAIANFSLNRSRRLRFQTIPYPYHNELKYLEEYRSLYTNSIFHALTGGDAEHEQALTADLIIQFTELEKVGLLLHRFGDSFSHQVIGGKKLYDPDWGHAKHGKSPDEIDQRNQQYKRYVESLYQVLTEVAKKRGVKTLDPKYGSIYINALSSTMPGSLRGSDFIPRLNSLGPDHADYIAKLVTVLPAGYNTVNLQVVGYEFDPWHNAENISSLEKNTEVGVEFRQNAWGHVEELLRDPRMAEFNMAISRKLPSTSPLNQMPFIPGAPILPHDFDLSQLQMGFLQHMAHVFSMGLYNPWKDRELPIPSHPRH